MQGEIFVFLPTSKLRLSRLVEFVGGFGE